MHSVLRFLLGKAGDEHKEDDVFDRCLFMLIMITKSSNTKMPLPTFSTLFPLL